LTGTLGIPFLDVVRVLAAVLLLGNIAFIESCLEMELQVEVRKVVCCRMVLWQLYSFLTHESLLSFET
jgi:hypothetical protein